MQKFQYIPRWPIRAHEVIASALHLARVVVKVACATDFPSNVAVVAEERSHGINSPDLATCLNVLKACMQKNPNC